MNKALLAAVVLAVTVGLLLPLILVLPVALIAASVQVAQHVCRTGETTGSPDVSSVSTTTPQPRDRGGGQRSE